VRRCNRVSYQAVPVLWLGNEWQCLLFLFCIEKYFQIDKKTLVTNVEIASFRFIGCDSIGMSSLTLRSHISGLSRLTRPDPER